MRLRRRREQESADAALDGPVPEEDGGGAPAVGGTGPEELSDDDPAATGRVVGPAGRRRRGALARGRQAPGVRVVDLDDEELLERRGNGASAVASGRTDSGDGDGVVDRTPGAGRVDFLGGRPVGDMDGEEAADPAGGEAPEEAAAGERVKKPLYPRLLRLRHIHPNAWQRAALGEGAIGVGVLLAMADLATAWGIVVIPLAVAGIVKAHDALQGLLEQGRDASGPGGAAA